MRKKKKKGDKQLTKESYIKKDKDRNSIARGSFLGWDALSQRPLVYTPETFGQFRHIP